jgi:hypothetical protein
VDAQSRYELLEIFAAANLRVQLIVVHNIVAMQATRTSPKVGRTINVADAEVSEVRDDRLGIPKLESCM